MKYLLVMILISQAANATLRKQWRGAIGIQVAWDRCAAALSASTEFHNADLVQIGGKNFRATQYFIEGQMTLSNAPGHIKELLSASLPHMLTVSKNRGEKPFPVALEVFINPEETEVSLVIDATPDFVPVYHSDDKEKRVTGAKITMKDSEPHKKLEVSRIVFDEEKNSAILENIYSFPMSVGLVDLHLREALSKDPRVASFKLECKTSGMSQPPENLLFEIHETDSKRASFNTGRRRLNVTCHLDYKLK